MTAREGGKANGSEGKTSRRAFDGVKKNFSSSLPFPISLIIFKAGGFPPSCLIRFLVIENAAALLQGLKLFHFGNSPPCLICREENKFSPGLGGIMLIINV
jgi:hypothetical protein